MTAYLNVPGCPVVLTFPGQDVEKVTDRVTQLARYPERVSQLDYAGGSVVLRLANVPLIQVCEQPPVDGRPHVDVELDQI